MEFSISGFTAVLLCGGSVFRCFGSVGAGGLMAVCRDAAARRRAAASPASAGCNHRLVQLSTVGAQRFRCAETFPGAQGPEGVVGGAGDADGQADGFSLPAGIFHRQGGIPAVRRFDGGRAWHALGRALWHARPVRRSIWRAGGSRFGRSGGRGSVRDWSLFSLSVGRFCRLILALAWVFCRALPGGAAGPPDPQFLGHLCLRLGVILSISALFRALEITKPAHLPGKIWPFPLHGKDLSIYEFTTGSRQT